MEFGERRRSAAIAYKSAPDLSDIELMGNLSNSGWNPSVFHIRGPDGSKGGRMTLCGTRPRPTWGAPPRMPEANQIVDAARGRRGWGSQWRASYGGSTPEGYYSYGYYGKVCHRCARRLMLKRA